MRSDLWIDCCAMLHQCIGGPLITRLLRIEIREFRVSETVLKTQLWRKSWKQTIASTVLQNFAYKVRDPCTTISKKKKGPGKTSAFL